MQLLVLVVIAIAVFGWIHAVNSRKYRSSIKGWLEENDLLATHGLPRMNPFQTTFATLEVEDRQGRRSVVKLRAAGVMRGSYHTVAKLVARRDAT